MNAHSDIPKPLFDVRALNVTKMDRIVDCDIAIAEADQALRGIARQMGDTSFNRDRAWLADATAAKADIEHKRTLLTMKRDALASSQGNQREMDARNAANKVSLRDHLAGQALAGLITHSEVLLPEKMAGVCYLYADALLAHRAREADGTKPS